MTRDSRDSLPSASSPSSKSFIPTYFSLSLNSISRLSISLMLFLVMSYGSMMRRNSFAIGAAEKPSLNALAHFASSPRSKLRRYLLLVRARVVEVLQVQVSVDVGEPDAGARAVLALAPERRTLLFDGALVALKVALRGHVDVGAASSASAHGGESSDSLGGWNTA